MGDIRDKLKSKRLFATGSVYSGDTILTTSFDEMSASFANNVYLGYDGTNRSVLGGLVYVVNEMQDDIENIHSEISESVFKGKVINHSFTVKGNILPETTATKTSGYTLGSDKLRWSKVYMASELNVSGSQLIISSPSASAAGDPFDIIVSGSILPADSANDSIGSEAAPFKDLYVTTGSIIYVDQQYEVGHARRKTL